MELVWDSAKLAGDRGFSNLCLYGASVTGSLSNLDLIFVLYLFIINISDYILIVISWINIDAISA